MRIRIRAREGELAAKLPGIIRAIERMARDGLVKAVKPDGKEPPRLIVDLQAKATARAKRIQNVMLRRMKAILDE